MDIEQIRREALKECAEQFELIDHTALKNTQKVLEAFKEARLSAYHFAGSSGYGYSDIGREKLDEVYAGVFKAEKAIVRPHFVSGTHALATVLCALLEKGDLLVSLIGAPYDTMQGVIGYARDSRNSLKTKGVYYEEVPLKDNTYDLEGIRRVVSERKPKVVLLQRSRGYSSRPSLRIEDIRKILEIVREASPQTICLNLRQRKSRLRRELTLLPDRSLRIPAAVWLRQADISPVVPIWWKRPPIT